MAWKTSIASSILKKKRNNNINLLPMSLSHVGKALLFAVENPIKNVSTDTPQTYPTERVRDIPLKRLQSPNEKLNNNEGITNMTGQTILIGEVISRLQKLQAEHGDVRCVTPGFDESYLDDVATVELVWIISNVRSPGHCGQHDEVDVKTPGAEKAVKINF